MSNYAARASKDDVKYPYSTHSINHHRFIDNERETLFTAMAIGRIASSLLFFGNSSCIAFRLLQF
jgi:hypothetical protein